MLVLFFIASAYSSGLDLIGKISASGELPLYMSITNQGEVADYYFTLELDHSLPINSNLIIDFPEQYSSPINTASLISSLGSVSINERSVIITTSCVLYSSVSNILVVYSVTNPLNKGGTGNFGLST